MTTRSTTGEVACIGRVERPLADREVAPDEAPLLGTDPAGWGAALLAGEQDRAIERGQGPVPETLLDAHDERCGGESIPVTVDVAAWARTEARSR